MKKYIKLVAVTFALSILPNLKVKAQECAISAADFVTLFTDQSKEHSDKVLSSCFEYQQDKTYKRYYTGAFGYHEWEDFGSGPDEKGQSVLRYITSSAHTFKIYLESLKTYGFEYVTIYDKWTGRSVNGATLYRYGNYSLSEVGLEDSHGKSFFVIEIGYFPHRF